MCSRYLFIPSPAAYAALVQAPGLHEFLKMELSSFPVGAGLFLGRRE